MKRRALLLVLLLLLLPVACDDDKKKSPTQPTSCVNIAGIYDATYATTCDSDRDRVQVVQSGCSFTAVFPGVASVQGTINGTSAEFTLRFASPCSGTARGTGTVQGNVVTGSFSGTAEGRFCCGRLTGTFRLVRVG